MKKISKELKITLVVIAAILVFIIGGNFLKGRNLIASDRRYYVIYDHIDQLTPSASVYFKGKKIGQVESIRFISSSDLRLIVCLLINERLDFPKNTVAEIYAADLLGTRAIEFIPGDAPTLLCQRDTLVASIRPDMLSGIGEQVGPAMKQIGSLVSHVDSLAISINHMFNETAQQQIQSAIANFSRSMAHIEKLSGDAQGLIADQKDQIHRIISNLGKVSDSLAQANIPATVEQLQGTLRSLDSVLTALHSGQGTAGKLMSDPKLYDELSGTTEALRTLLIDLKAHPKRYVQFSLFGRKDKTRDSISSKQ